MWDKIQFFKSVSDYPFAEYADHVMHILCTAGNMSFTFQDVRYNVVRGDYVILPNPSLASDFSESEDLEAVIMCLSEPFSPHDYRICMEDLLRIRERLAEDGHWFREEMMGYLLLAHILDLYDIHAKSRTGHNLSERNGDLLRRFIELLYHKEYIKDRSLSHYASKLCITPHYLTEVCKKASGKPAT